ncbi:hypothetical protein KQ941_14040 [Paenibacillus xylanexedens]|uniref:hypothetical protein n=1 Tax=Paenibacillus xylanexedens TaxID=528191 RepID=UPI001F35D68B|nr:hypothetical protein [Paenibacillus xylanexedens]MCF7755569.1 hypothetical protein [Paenibacillus xylanexedens]
MNVQYIKLRTLANKPIVFQGLNIFPKSLDAIVEAGYENFNEKLNLVSLRIEDIYPSLSLKEYDGTLIELLLYSRNESLVATYLNAFHYFLNVAIQFSYSDSCIMAGDISLSYSDLEHIVKIIQIQHCVVTKQDDDFNPLNERASALREKMLARKRRVRELKESSSSEDALTFTDLISILSSNANGINILNVFDLNFFQFNDQFNRMKLLDDYEVNIQALLHGADSKSIKLKHWISPLN